MLAGASGHDTTKVNELNDLSFKNLYSNIYLAKQQAFKALELAKIIHFRKGEAGAYNRVGVVYDVSGNYDSALYYYWKAYELNKEIKNLKGEGSALSNIGLTYWNKGDYNNALSNFYAAINPLEAIGHYHFLGNCYNNIGLVFFELKNYPKAKGNFNAALRNYDLAKRDYEKANVLCNIGMVLSGEGKPDSSILINLKAINIYQQEDDYYNLGKAYSNTANDYTTINDFPNAIDFYKKAIVCHKKAENITGLGESLMYLAELYQNINKQVLSEQYVNEAFLISKNIESPKVLSNIFYHYALIKKQNGDYKTAAEYLKRVNIMRDSLFDNETSELIAATEAKFGVERKENENKQLLQQNKIQELQINNAQTEIKSRKQLTYGITAFALLLTLSGYLYFKRRQAIQKLIAKNLVNEAEHHQRVSISNDLHDNVGAQLSYIVSNLDVMENIVPGNTRLKSVADMSKQAILTLRETVWALNNETVTTEAFADKFKLYALKMLDFNTTLHCNFHEDIKRSFVLRPMQALNLFRICQEAFSNVIKHSEASSIDIYFYDSDSSIFDFKIKDNGQGFDYEEGRAKGHFGLLNMQSRAKEAGAGYSIESKKGEGTIVTISLKS